MIEALIIITDYGTVRENKRALYDDVTFIEMSYVYSPYRMGSDIIEKYEKLNSNY